MCVALRVASHAVLSLHVNEPSDPLRAFIFFFFNDTATTEIYTLSLHDALPICPRARSSPRRRCGGRSPAAERSPSRDRKSTRLNSSHGYISYAVFCLKKKKTQTRKTPFHQRSKNSACKMQSDARHTKLSPAMTD